eukprot:UN4667
MSCHSLMTEVCSKVCMPCQCMAQLLLARSRALRVDVLRWGYLPNAQIDSLTPLHIGVQRSDPALQRHCSFRSCLLDNLQLLVKGQCASRQADTVPV